MRNHCFVWYHEDISRIFIRLQKSYQVLFPLIQDHDLISDPFFEEEYLRRISRCMMFIRIYLVCILNQNPQSINDFGICNRLGVCTNTGTRMYKANQMLLAHTSDNLVGH